MANVVLTLGGVTFQDFEVPEKIAFGGAQRIAVHELIGGGRVLDALGPTPGQINFAGVFAGSDAAARAQSLDAATAAGAQIQLLWDRFSYLVIIDKFDAAYEKPWWIPFSIVCDVVLDPVAAIAAAVASAARLISADIGTALSLSSQAGLSLGLSSAPTLDAIGSAQSVIAGSVASTGSALDADVASIGNAADAASGIAGLAELVGSSGQLAALTGMSGYINRAATNLANQLT